MSEKLEEKLYEARPFVYFVLSFYALVLSRSSSLMVVSGAILLLAGGWVLKMRNDYRLYYRQQSLQKTRQARSQV